MSKRTVLNEGYKGLVEALSIHAELHERDGSRFASFCSAMPIHCCSEEQVLERSAATHHYCGIFTEQTLAPLGELAYVRLDEHTAEKVFINRSKRMLLTSADGTLAQWRSVPSFESANHFMAGTPIVDQSGALVSLVTAKRGNHYAISTFEGDGGYFDTPLPWQRVSSPGLVYGTSSFPSREQLRAHVATLPPGPAHCAHATPVLHHAATPRVVLMADNGRQLAHIYLPGVITDVEYL